MAETQVLSGRFLLLKFAAIFAWIIGRLAEAAFEADGALAFHHQSVSPAFPAVSAGALDGAGMLVLLAMVALEGFGALADVFIFDRTASASVFAGRGSAGRLLAILARVALEAFAHVIATVFLAETLVQAGDLHHARVDVLLAILPGKIGLASASVLIRANVVANGVVLAGLFG